MTSKKQILLALLDPEEMGINVSLNVENYLTNNTTLQPTTCMSSYMYVNP
jgi:hypothetical protein